MMCILKNLCNLQNINMAETVQEILLEQIQYSSYSAEQSFTLSDILVEKDDIEDKRLLQAELFQLDLDGFDDQGMFSDDQQEAKQVQEQKIQQNTNEVALDTIKPEKQTDHQHVRKSRLRKSSGKNIQKQASSNRVSTYEQTLDRCRRIQNLSVPPISQIKNIAFIVLNNVTAAFDSTAKGVGIPTVVTSNSIKYLAVGTSFGNIVLFEVGNKGKIVLGTAENRKFGMISAMAISKEGRYLVSGQQNGLITLWDLTNNQQLKKEIASDTKIIKMLFCSQNQFILADADGNVFLFTIQNYFWFKLKRDRLFQKTKNIYYDIKIHSLQSGMEAIVLCSLEQVLVASYKPKVEAIDKLTRPEQFNQSKIPNIQIGKTAILSIHNPNNKRFQYNDVLCISWSNHIFVYKFMQGVRIQKLELVYRFSQETPIYNMEFISQGVLVTLDNKQTFRSYRLWINNNGGHILLNEKTIPEEVIYQRYVRDNSKRYIKLFNNTIISCSFSPKQKELFFIAKNSIYRCRVYKWNDYVSDIINVQHKYQMALRICIEIYHQRMNIFLEPVYINEKTMKILYEVGRIYMKKRFALIQKLKLERTKNMETKDDLKLVEEQVKQTFDCIIEYMLELKSAIQLFSIVLETFKKEFTQDEYSHCFFECLTPFIMRGRLTSIPSKQIFQGLMIYYLTLNNRQLIDNFIMFLNKDTLSMFYYDAIDTCRQNKLYKSLTYVCATHEDYIPPLTALIHEVRVAQMNKLEMAEERYYAMLKDYISKLLKGQYINGTHFEDNNSIMMKSLSNWLMCTQTFTFFTKNTNQLYRHDYFQFVEELVYLLSANKKLEDYIHSELKHIRNEKEHLNQVAQIFIKISQIITLQPEQIKLVVKNSNSDLISHLLPKYLNFYRSYYSQLIAYENIQEFYTLNKQLHYFHHLMKTNQEETQKIGNLLEKVNLLDDDFQLNGQLTKFLLSKMQNKQIVWDLEELLKINSENTMIFMLERFSLDTVDERLMSIKDKTYRYIIVRKLLKKLRKQNNMFNRRQKIKKYRKKRIKIVSPVSSGGSFLLNNESKHLPSSQSETDSVMDISQADKFMLDYRKLGKQVMQFYIECLCKYKNEKRVYYEFICNMNDYSDSIQELISIIKQYQYHSCLGLLQETRKNYEESFTHYYQVYKQFFFEENYKKLVKYTHCHGRFVRRMFDRMLSLSTVINTDQQWIQLLQCVINPLEQKSLKRHQRGKQKYLVCDDIQEAFLKEPQKYVFIKQLGQILQECLINVSAKIPLQKVSAYIGQHQYVFSRMFVLESFRTTLLTYTKNSYIFHVTNEMIIKNQVQTFEQIYNNLVRGFPVNVKCQKCGQSFDQENKMNTYQCGHSFHRVCPIPSDKIVSKIAYETSFMRTSSMIQSGCSQQEEQKCPKCEHERTNSHNNVPEEILPDFHKEYEQNILVKGMVGIVTIIPNMINAIPESLNAFSSKNQSIQNVIVAPIKEQEVTTELEDQVLGFLAFNENLFGIEEQNENFIQECGKYFDQEPE